MIDPNRRQSSSLRIAGPRDKIFFNPEETKVGIVTCGGLSPGLNNVVRTLVLCLWYRYGVRQFVGLKYGYEGKLHSLCPGYG